MLLRTLTMEILRRISAPVCLAPGQPSIYVASHKTPKGVVSCFPFLFSISLLLQREHRQALHTRISPYLQWSQIHMRASLAGSQATYFKLRLLECVAGLDRGFAANAYAAMQVESAALALTEQSEPVMLSWTSGADPSLLEQQIMTI